MFHRYSFRPVLVLLGLIGTGFAVLPTAPVQAAEPLQPITCAYDPSSGMPNPIGMRASVTLYERGGHTEAVYEVLPSPVAGEARVTVAHTRTMTFYDMSTSEVRQLMLRAPSYYRELIGLTAPISGTSTDPLDTFEALNTVLVCRADTTTPTATASSSTTAAPLPALEPTEPITPTPSGGQAITLYDTIASLPDGNYRYWSGQTTTTTVSDEELLRLGGALFVFRKQGDIVTGSFGAIDHEAICVAGRISGNTLSGQAFPFNGEVQTVGETFQPWNGSTFLEVRRSQVTNGRGFYDGAILNLNGFSRINAGRVLPPSQCTEQ
jgi:hypothetical protein